VLSSKIISEIQQKYHIKPDMQVRTIQGQDFQIDILKYDQFIPDCKSFVVYHFIKKTGLDLKIFQC